ncbi:MAG: PilZ domain-containing protein [Magnetococcales bacterium]|nr:PilZ domain-containing protein [Magnetococcales bacterium]NGZ26602.1 PilZ domain-containing protein [Magnetococcales bacterium]
MPPDALPTQYDKILSDSQKVRSLLEGCLAEGERIELELDSKVRLFYTVLLDHPEEEPEGEGAEKSFLRKHKPGYLWAGTHVVLAPLIPTLGNLMLKKMTEPKGILRFFKDLRAYEANVDFLRSDVIRDEPVLIFSYPKKFGILNKRRHYRMRIPDSFPITASVTIADDPDVNHLPVQVYDVSAGGLGFIHKIAEEKFEPEMKIALTIRIPGIIYLKIPAFVRSQAQLNLREVKVEGIATRMLVGVQFDICSLEIEGKVSGLVAHLQQSQLAQRNDYDDDAAGPSGVLQFKDTKSQPAPTPPPTEKPERPKLPEREVKTEPPKEKKEGGWLKGLLGGDNETTPPPDTQKKQPLDQIMDLKKKNIHKIQ